MTLLKFDNVGLRYGIGPEVLKDINFKLKPGSFHFLTGASGAGKTSLMKLIYLAQLPTRGLVTMLDRDVVALTRNQRAQLRRQIGIVFQDFRLFNHMSVYDNVALPLRIDGKSESYIKKSVPELLNWVGLGGKLDAKPLTISGGEQQRTAIARAIINKPKLLLADEPTGSVDDNISRKLMTLFEELNKHGTTVILATHDQKIIQNYPHSTLHIDKGTLVQAANNNRHKKTSDKGQVA